MPDTEGEHCDKVRPRFTHNLELRGISYRRHGTKRCGYSRLLQEMAQSFHSLQSPHVKSLQSLSQQRQPETQRLLRKELIAALKTEYSELLHQEVHNLGDNNDDNTRVRFLEVGDIGNFNNITTHNFF